MSAGLAIVFGLNQTGIYFKKVMSRYMFENSLLNLKPMNRLEFLILLLTTNLSWCLLKKKITLTVSTVSLFLK